MSGAARIGIERKLWLGRSAEQAEAWIRILAGAGRTNVGTLPLVARRPLPLSPEQRALVAGLDAADVLFLTSAAAVELLLADAGLRAALARCRLAVVGPATARALEREAPDWPGRAPDLVARPARGGALARAFLKREPRPAGRLVYYGHADPHPELGERLAAAGLALQRVAAYEVEELPGPEPAGEEIILLFSPSSARSLRRRTADAERHPVLAIGPSTAAAAREHGFPVIASLDQPTPQALLACLASA